MQGESRGDLSTFLHFIKAHHALPHSARACPTYWVRDLELSLSTYCSVVPRHAMHQEPPKNTPLQRPYYFPSSSSSFLSSSHPDHLRSSRTSILSLPPFNVHVHAECGLEPRSTSRQSRIEFSTSRFHGRNYTTTPGPELFAKLYPQPHPISRQGQRLE